MAFRKHARLNPISIRREPMTREDYLNSRWIIEPLRLGPACPHCFSMKWEWALMRGRGTLHNYVVYHKAWTKWFESRVPYAVIQVELEEGPRLTANMADCDLKDIKIGMPVEAVYEDITGEITLINFRPVRSAR